MTIGARNKSCISAFIPGSLLRLINIIKNYRDFILIFVFFIEKDLTLSVTETILQFVKLGLNAPTIRIHSGKHGGL